MSTVTPPPFALADVRQVGVACATDAWYYTQFTACGSKQSFSGHLSRWLQSVNYQFTAQSSRPPCFWIEVSIDLQSDHDRVVFVPMKGYGSGDTKVERPIPSGEIVAWDEFRNAMMDATWTDCSKGNGLSIDDTHPVSSSAVSGVSQFNIYSHAPSPKLDNTLSFVLVRCGKDQSWLYLQKYCGSTNAAGEGSLDLKGLTDDVHDFIDNSWGHCTELGLSFQARDGWLAPGTMYHVWLNQDRKATSVEGSKIRSMDWKDFDSALRGARWPSCTEITDPSHNPPTERAPPPGFSWITSSNMYNGWKLNSDADAVAGCPGTQYHFSPNYRHRTRPQEGVIWDVDEWISHLKTCITSASEAHKMWITGDFIWSESQDGITERAGYSFFIVTQYWEEKGQSAPIPPGKRIRWDDFVVKMRRQQWDPPYSWTMPDGIDSHPKIPTRLLSSAVSNAIVIILPLIVVICLLARRVSRNVGRTLVASKT